MLIRDWQWYLLNSLFSFTCDFLFHFMVYLCCIVRVWSVGVFIIAWCILGHFLVYLLLVSRVPKCLSTSFPKAFELPYNPHRDFLIVMCSLHLVVGESESLGKHMVDGSFWMSLEWVLLIKRYYLPRLSRLSCF